MPASRAACEMEPVSATAPASYGLSVGTVNTAALSPDGKTVTLGVSGITAVPSVALTVTGLMDTETSPSP